MRQECKDQKILVVRCKHQGDFNNILGIASAISERTNYAIEVIDLRIRANLFIPVMLGALTQLPSNSSLMHHLLKLFFRGHLNKRLPHSVSYVISTLGAGEAPNVFLSRATHAKGIHLGTPKRIPRRYFDCVISHQGHSGLDKELVLPISPSKIRRSNYKSLDQRHSILLAIGGDAKETCYPANFWELLVAQTARLASREAADWIVTTSPRTGPALEERLSLELSKVGKKPKITVIYGDGDAPSMSALLSDVGILIASCESVSMISEGIASGAKVIAAFSSSLPRSDRIRKFLQLQVQEKRIAMWDLAVQSQPQFDDLAPLQECWSDTLWDRIH